MTILKMSLYCANLSNLKVAIRIAYEDTKTNGWRRECVEVERKQEQSGDRDCPGPQARLWTQLLDVCDDILRCAAADCRH